MNKQSTSSEPANELIGPAGTNAQGRGKNPAPGQHFWQEMTTFKITQDNQNSCQVADSKHASETRLHQGARNDFSKIVRSSPFCLHHECHHKPISIANSELSPCCSKAARRQLLRLHEWRAHIVRKAVLHLLRPLPTVGGLSY